MFAVITVALITGAVVERIKFQFAAGIFQRSGSHGLSPVPGQRRGWNVDNGCPRQIRKPILSTPPAVPDPMRTGNKPM